MQGRIFLGKNAAPAPKYIFGARDRADDMPELSRAVHDGRYIYVRHYLPHLPYIQSSRIFSNEKESLAELRRARDAGEMNNQQLAIFAKRKPIEELYDLRNDPHELNNLADDPDQAARLDSMRMILRKWILDHRDTGFLPEAEYHRRARELGVSIYEFAQNDEAYPLEQILNAAEVMSRPTGGVSETALLGSDEPGIRWWGLQGLLMRPSPPTDEQLDAVRPLLEDESPSVAIAAAQALSGNDQDRDKAFKVLLKHLASDQPTLALEAAIALRDLGPALAPIAHKLEAARKALEGDTPRKYKDFNYPSFTGWALEQALINSGTRPESDFPWK